MIITSVSRKDSNNVVVYLDNEEKLYLSYEIFLKNGLRKGKEISEDLFSFLIRENQKYFIKNRALHFLSRRLHSSFEIAVKLRQKKPASRSLPSRQAGSRVVRYDSDLIEEVLTELQANGILDDYNFALQYADENIRNKLWGKVKIRSEMRKRGIDLKIIDEVLEMKFPSGNDLNMAVELAKKKIKSLSYKKLDKVKLQQKVISYLYSKGYDYETSKEAIDKLFSA
jgi:regulatory protein